jgi:hypothetical protein
MALLVVEVESVHAAPFWHGDESHSSTSTSQFPLKALAPLFGTVHCAVYWLM